MLKRLLSFLPFYIFLIWTPGSAQIIFTESFTVILDSSKKVQGSIIPDFKFQTQRRNLIEFQNLADISFRMGDNALTFANKIEVSRFGKEALLSGGYLYVEYRRILENTFVPEFYSQIHWADARGMRFKYAGGINARFRIAAKENMGFFAGIGPFYEYERWNYNGVSDSALIPADPIPIEVSHIKLGLYVNLKYSPADRISTDFSVYYQSRFDGLFSTPRLASSSRVSYRFTKHLSLAGMYQNIYDFAPVVPIKQLFNRVTLSVSISF
jgi:hypothetical protein